MQKSGEQGKIQRKMADICMWMAICFAGCAVSMSKKSGLEDDIIIGVHAAIV